MDNKKDLSLLIDQIDKSNQKQAKYAKLQCIFSAVAAVCCVAILIVALTFIPKLTTLIEQANVVIENAQTVTSELAQANWDELISNLEQVSDQLAEADLNSIAHDVSQLVESCQAGVEDALEKLNSIDLNTLNKAIKDLSDVVAPLAKFFNIF